MSSPAPHDLELERDLVGSLAGWYHFGAPPDPGDFYDPRLGRMARAFVDHRDAITYIGLDWLERDDGYLFAYLYRGLAEVLAALGSAEAERDAIFVGILAASARVTTGLDVDRLVGLAHARFRLIELETERRELLEALG